MVIGGVDEVGRGCLAGPVVAGAVILNSPIQGLDDSKKLTKKKREILFSQILESAVCSIGIIWSSEIDQLNILNATKKAMQIAISRLSVRPDYLRIDGMSLEIDIENKGIIGGDSLYPEIMAASIIAKVTRDEIMRSFDFIYPEFRFGKNMGYGTKHHLNLINNHQYTPIHRKSFNPLKSLLQA